MLSDLSDLEQDALTELVNIAVSGAASRLRTMVGSEVSLTVPVVRVVGSEEAARSIGEFAAGPLQSIRQGFKGRVSGQTMLVFQGNDSAPLVRAILGEGYSDAEYADLADDTMGEIGNILLLGFLATIGSMLGMTFEVGLPKVEVCDGADLFAGHADHAILIIYVNFQVRGISARGFFSLVLSLGSLTALKEIISAFVAEITRL
jgi:chemotaxis protein CheC